jgi:hypothetical protein
LFKIITAQKNVFAFSNLAQFDRPGTQGRFALVSYFFDNLGYKSIYARVEEPIFRARNIFESNPSQWIPVHEDPPS